MGRTSLAAKLLIGAITVYQKTISPTLPNACRYQPSCSVYAQDALRKHGAIKGTWLAARRLVRCAPWGSHGYDPVP